MFRRHIAFVYAVVKVEMFPFQTHGLLLLHKCRTLILQRIHFVELLQCVMQFSFLFYSFRDRQSPSSALGRHWRLMGDKSFLVVLAAKRCGNKRCVVFFQLFLHVGCGGIVIRHHQHCFALTSDVGNEI